MAAKSGSNRVPIAQGQIPPENKVFRDFGGLNTQAARQAIQDNEFAWIENVIPIGFANAKAVEQISAALATISGGRTIYYRKSYNITGTAYLFVACTDGSAWQVAQDSPYTVTQIAAGGTFSGSATQITQWKNERILIIDTNANGYRDWNGETLTILAGTTGAPTGGTCIATYSFRVWIVQSSGNGRTIAYSQPDSYTDFTSTGGTTTITDETLISSIQQFLVANNFLYFFGTDSINVISDVQVVSGATQFSNTNIVANSGTDLPNAIVSFYRPVWYMNKSGIFALYGATPRKASDALDGIFPLIDFTKPVTGGTVTIFNQLCVAFLFTYNDPAAGQRQLMAIYLNKKWFLASQSVEVTGMASQNGGMDTLWGTAGANVYKLFNDSSSNIAQTLKTRLWDMDDFISIKETLNLGVEMITPAVVGGITPTVDTEQFVESPDNLAGNSSSFIWYGVAVPTTPYFCVLSGAVTDFASTPDAPANEIGPDLEIKAYVVLADWRPASTNTIIAKWRSGTNQQAYEFQVIGAGFSGFLRLNTSATGADTVTSMSTVTAGGTDGQGLWVRVTRDGNDGGGNRVTKFYTSTQAPTTPVASVTWTQLGATVTEAATTIFSSSAELRVGAEQTGAVRPLQGDVYSCYLYSDLVGTLAASFVPNDTTPGMTSWNSALTGETWTLQGVAEIDATKTTDTSLVFPWTNSLGATFTWLLAGYVWYQGNVQVQGHYLGVSITSNTPGNIFEGIQLQFRRLPAGWGT